LLTLAEPGSRHIIDRPAHPLRVVAEKSQSHIAGMAKEAAHDLALARNFLAIVKSFRFFTPQMRQRPRWRLYIAL
jgi:hypothetical protein